MSLDDLSQTILAREEARCAALLSRDADELSDLLSEQLVFVHANATTDKKASLLSKIKSGAITYNSLTIEDGKVAPCGADAAILTGSLVAEVSVRGSLKTLRNRVLLVWLKEDRTWRLLAYQPTPLPA